MQNQKDQISSVVAACHVVNEEVEGKEQKISTASNLIEIISYHFDYKNLHKAKPPWLTQDNYGKMMDLG